MADDFISKVKSSSPFPWRQVVHPNGLIQIFDAMGREVPIFTLTEFAVFITSVMSAQKEKTT